MVKFFQLFKKEPSPFIEEKVLVEKGHKIHFMAYGNPKGKTVLCFHGGPGSRASVYKAMQFDLKKYRVLVFDQRGCGLSESDDIYENNTPQKALSDAVFLLHYLKWPMKELIVSGSSYGSTLALLFAIKHPQSVKALALSSIFLGRKQDLDWTVQSACFYPELHRQMREHIKPKETLADGYFRLINSEKYQDIKTALELYGSYEWQLGSLVPRFNPLKGVKDKDIQSLRIFLHYETNGLFLKKNEILNNIGKIRYIPTLIVHNRLDMTCPIEQADALNQHMVRSKYVVVPDIGHSSDMLKKVFKKETAAFLNTLK